MNVRRATPQDAPEIAEMIRALARDSGSEAVPKITADHIREHGFGPHRLLWIWIAELDGKPVGTVLLEPMFSTWRGQKGFYVVDLFVDAAHRGKGIGECLMRSAARDALASGGAFLRLEVEQTNPAARRLYTRLGFDASTHELMYLSLSEMLKLAGSGPIQ